MPEKLLGAFKIIPHLSSIVPDATGFSFFIFNRPVDKIVIGPLKPAVLHEFGIQVALKLDGIA